MPRRVFVDVGAHLGETLEEVVRPRWRFDRIWTFEPASSCLPSIRRFVDERVEVVPAGWWTSTTTMELHDPGAIGASVAAEKALTDEVEQCQFIDAAGWVEEHLRDDDTVWLKLNCEGAECDVLDRLLDAGAMARFDHVLVHFDVEKIPSMAHRAEVTRRRLDAAGVDYVEPSRVFFGRSHAAKTANWLAWTEAEGLQRVRYTHLNRMIFRGRQLLYPAKVRVHRWLSDRRRSRHVGRSPAG